MCWRLSIALFDETGALVRLGGVDVQQGGTTVAGGVTVVNGGVAASHGVHVEADGATFLGGLTTDVGVDVVTGGVQVSAGALSVNGGGSDRLLSARASSSIELALVQFEADSAAVQFHGTYTGSPSAYLDVVIDSVAVQGNFPVPNCCLPIDDMSSHVAACHDMS